MKTDGGNMGETENSHSVNCITNITIDWKLSFTCSSNKTHSKVGQARGSTGTSCLRNPLCSAAGSKES